MQGLILDANEFFRPEKWSAEERFVPANEDGPSYALSKPFAQAFMSHPYHWLRSSRFSPDLSMNLDDLQRHYDTYYCRTMPRWSSCWRDIKAEALLPVIARLFELIPKGPSPKTLTVTEVSNGECRFLPEARGPGPLLCHDGIPVPELHPVTTPMR